MEGDSSLGSAARPCLPPSQSGEGWGTARGAARGQLEWEHSGHIPAAPTLSWVPREREGIANELEES